LPLKCPVKSFETSFHEFLQQLLLNTGIDGEDQNIEDYKSIFHKLKSANFDELDFVRFIEEMQLGRKLTKKTTVAEAVVIDEFYNNDTSKKEDFGKTLVKRCRKVIFESKFIEYTILIGWCGFLALALFLEMGIIEAAGGSTIFIICLFLAKKKIGNNIPHFELNDKEWGEVQMEGKPDVNEMKTFDKPFIFERFSDTILIEEMKRPYIALLEDDGGSHLDVDIQDKHYIDSGIFIGRNKDLVNIHFLNQEVGKVHSEIWKEASKIYIKDLNSMNGTWLNGIRLKTDEALELKDGDIIIFAIRKCIFRNI